MKPQRNLFLIGIAVIAALIIGLQITAFSQNNDPNEEIDANACYAGGSMEGKCVTEEDWEAGWYVIRYEYGLISAEDFPDWLKWALPDPETTEEPRTPRPTDIEPTYEVSNTPIMPSLTPTPTFTPEP